MKIGQQIKFITMNKQAKSLYSLIADGQYRKTSLGRNTWKSLIGSPASLQTQCNKEGFNIVENIGVQDRKKEKIWFCHAQYIKLLTLQTKSYKNKN